MFTVKILLYISRFLTLTMNCTFGHFLWLYVLRCSIRSLAVFLPGAASPVLWHWSILWTACESSPRYTVWFFWSLAVGPICRPASHCESMNDQFKTLVTKNMSELQKHALSVFQNNYWRGVNVAVETYVAADGRCVLMVCFWVFFSETKATDL